ncbi:hypothetical protein EV360DRAFT_57133 [Lentinula raphanica]|nr:hypothetical protein EV360DRAFT_57133 [Lentinula raphanica]
MAKGGAGKKKDKGPELPAIAWSDNQHYLSFALLTEVEKDENRAGKCIAAVIIPKSHAINPTNASKRCVDHWNLYRMIFASIESDLMISFIRLVKKYKEHAKRLRKTGEGVRNDDEEIPIADDQEKDKYLDSYVGPQGPDETMPDRIRNIWEDIINKFPLFPRLHTLLAARANITPPQLTTGVGPSGRTVLHLQMPQVESSALALPTPAMAGNSMLDDSQGSIPPRPSTFGSFSPSDNSYPATPIPPTLDRQAQPAASSSLNTAIEKARGNRSRPQKHTAEDRLFDIHL